MKIEQLEKNLSAQIYRRVKRYDVDKNIVYYDLDCIYGVDQIELYHKNLSEFMSHSHDWSEVCDKFPNAQIFLFIEYITPQLWKIIYRLHKSVLFPIGKNDRIKNS